MFYIVQENVFKEHNYNKIFEALDKLDLEYEIVKAESLADELQCETLRTDVFAFGSVRLARLAVNKNWLPGSFYGGNHDYSVYNQFYKDNLLNYDSEIVNFGKELDWLPNEIKFIRPTADSKYFTGGLFTKTKWEDLQDSKVALTQYNYDTLIQVGSPKKIYKEARIWIVDGKIVTSSYYKFGDNVMWEEFVEPEGLEFAKSMINIYQVAEAFVMDICLTPDGWKIVEINCINCSGFYQGDLQKIIIALEDKYNPL